MHRECHSLEFPGRKLNRCAPTERVPAAALFADEGKSRGARLSRVLANGRLQFECRAALICSAFALYTSPLNRRFLTI